MRTFILLVLSSLSAFGGDTGIRSFSAVTTNSAGTVYIEDIFTRGGQTNLVRLTKVEAGVVTHRIQKFYHHGDLVAVISGLSDSNSFSSEPRLPYRVDLEFLPSKDVRCLIIFGPGFIDGFYPTNGIYYPAPDSDLK